MGGFDTDVFVCGGGPAGLAAAIVARQRGFEVMVADCFKPPIDKACGEGLMPDSLAGLTALGVTLPDAAAGIFKGIRFVEGQRAVEACFPQGTGRGVRRVVLHDLMRQRAEDLGVQFHWGTQVMGVADGVVRMDDQSVRPRWVVGADGMNSRIRKWAALDGGKRLSRRIGLRQHYKVPPWNDFVEVHWSDAGQAYVTPIGTNEVCVAVVGRDRFRSVDGALSLFTELAERLAGVAPASSERGALTTGHVYQRVTRGNTALLGDASGSVDAIVGDGLSLAFQQAEALGEALVAGDLEMYEAAHRSIRRVPTFMSQSMLLMDRYGMLRRRSLGTFSRNPWLFERMLSVHVGAVPLRVWGRTGVLNMGVQLLTR